MVLFNNLKKSYLAHQESIDTAVNKVLKSGWLILGNEVAHFEKEFSGYIGNTYCVGVGSGTDAITLALRAVGVGEGDEVITSNVTAFPTITGIIQARATPVVVDINSDDGLIDISKIEPKISKSTKAIIPVHLYGQCCDMEKLQHLADTHNLVIIEDAAQAAGATFKDKKAGSFGLCGAFSFYPTKNLGGIGDGGAITTNNESVFKKLLLLRNYGQNKRYFHDIAGTNSRLDEIQAAVLRTKLSLLDNCNKRRNEIALAYRKHIINFNLLMIHEYGFSNNHLFVIKCHNRNELQSYLNEKGIQTLIHYPLPINKQHGFLWQKSESFPQSDLFTSEILSLPLYPELENDEVHRIIEAINGFR